MPPFSPLPPSFLYSQADAIVTADAKTKTRHVRQRQLRSLSGWRSGLNRVCIVGNSLIFPISFALLAKFEAGKPGGESVSASVCTDALPVFSVSVLLHSRTLTEFSGQSGRRVRECIGVYRRTAGVFRAIRAASLGA